MNEFVANEYPVGAVMLLTCKFVVPLFLTLKKANSVSPRFNAPKLIAVGVTAISGIFSMVPLTDATE